MQHINAENRQQDNHITKFQDIFRPQAVKYT